QRGVLIARVYPDTPADKAGLRVEDIIIELAGERVTSIEKLREVIRAHKIGDGIEVAFVRDGETLRTAAILAEMPRQF
ncbi:MAG: PDZ domain-containing protein, partial [Dehalococcoidia bacterium]